MLHPSFLPGQQEAAPWREINVNIDNVFLAGLLTPDHFRLVTSARSASTEPGPPIFRRKIPDFISGTSHAAGTAGWVEPGARSLL